MTPQVLRVRMPRVSLPLRAASFDLFRISLVPGYCYIPFHISRTLLVTSPLLVHSFGSQLVMQSSFFFLAAASLASGAIIRRGDPTMQEIPTKAKADNTFSNGKPYIASGPVVSATPPTDIYGVRTIDLPFGRLYHGDMKFFSAGQLNSPDGITDKWMGQPGVYDSANQSACGIPDNAFSISKVAIHPYFLKYADLSRKLRSR